MGFLGAAGLTQVILARHRNMNLVTLSLGHKTFKEDIAHRKTPVGTCSFHITKRKKELIIQGSRGEGRYPEVQKLEWEFVGLLGDKAEEQTVFQNCFQTVFHSSRCKWAVRFPPVFLTWCLEQLFLVLL